MHQPTAHQHKPETVGRVVREQPVVGPRNLFGQDAQRAELRHAGRDWPWTFVDEPGLEPTNNASERSLRHAVIWRKLSFGTQSERGSRFVERMLTVIETCRQQSRSAFEFLSTTIQAHFQNQTPPSLLANV